MSSVGGAGGDLTKPNPHNTGLQIGGFADELKKTINAADASVDNSSRTKLIKRAVS